MLRQTVELDLITIEKSPNHIAQFRADEKAVANYLDERIHCEPSHLRFRLRERERNQELRNIGEGDVGIEQGLQKRSAQAIHTRRHEVHGTQADTDHGSKRSPKSKDDQA